MDLSDPTTAALKASLAIEQAGQNGAVYGGLALAVWGTPRETRDADFAVCHADLERILVALRSGGLDPRVNFRSLQFGGNSISRIEVTGTGGLEGFNVIALVEPRSERYAHAVLRRAIGGAIRGQAVRVVSPEDFIVLKVLSTRDRDLEDAVSVLRSLGGRLDIGVIHDEVAALDEEIEDHPCTDRWLRVSRGAS